MSMETLPAFELRRPVALGDALALLAADPAARVLAGGTDLVPNLRRGIEQPALLVDVSALDGFAQIESGDDGLRLGAGVTLARLEADTQLSKRCAALAQAAAAVAGPGHRTVATLGGNLCLDTRCIYYNQSEWWRAANGYCLKRGGTTCHVAPQGQHCHAAFSGDVAPALMALDAEVELASVRGTRRQPLAELYRDDGAAHLTLARDEILTAVWLPPAPAGQASGYRKARVRGAMDFPLAGVAAALSMDGGALRSLRVALTGTNSNPFVLAGCDAFIGQPVDDGMLAKLSKLVQKQVSPMRSTVTQSNYRRMVAAALAQRLVLELVNLD